jgi:drug/metabolite transporter (DMT)-like permease
LLGILLKVMATFVFTLMAIVGRSLGGEIRVGEVVFFPCGVRVPATDRLDASPRRFRSVPSGRAIRCCTQTGRHGVLAMFSVFSALMYLPVADLTAIGFASPLIVVVLAASLLGERVRKLSVERRWGWGFRVMIMLAPHLSGQVESGLGVMLRHGQCRVRRLHHDLHPQHEPF